MKRRTDKEDKRHGGGRGNARGDDERRRTRDTVDLRRRAESFLRLARNELASIPVDNLQTLVHELQMHQVELEMQNEELRRAQLELAHARDRYTDLYEFAPAGYLTLDRGGIIREANLTAASLLRMERRALVGKRFSTPLVSPEFRDTWYRHIAAVRAGPLKQTCDLVSRHEDGEPVWLRLESVANITEGAGRPWECRVLLTDVSERKLAQQQLAESDARLRLALAVGNVAEWTWNLQDDSVNLSARWKAQLGFTERGLPNHFEEWVKRLHPDDRPRMLELVRAYRENPWPEYEAEYRLRHKNGSYHWFLARADFRCDARGVPLEMLGCQIDVTARKRAEEELRVLNNTLEQRVAERTAELRVSNKRLETEAAARSQAEVSLRDSEQQLRTVIETATDSIIIIDAKGIIRSVNTATERMFGYRAQDMLGRNVNMLMPPPYHVEHDGYIAHYLETGEPRIIGIGREVLALRKNGSLFPIDLAVSEFHDGEPMFTGIIRDITERKNLQRAVALGVAEEQKAIGRELHDGTAQDLTAMAMMAGALHARLEQSGSPAAENMSRLLAELERAQGRLRKIIRGVYRYSVQAGGLADALRDLCEDTESLHRLRCIFRIKGEPAVPDTTTATQLYYIAREAVHNALRHAHAEHVTVELKTGKNGVLLSVQDDGKGIVPKRVRSGMGTQIMQYRASIIGATLSFSPLPNRGTLVTCLLPANPAQG